MATIHDEEERFQVRAAWLYHVEGLTQGRIAEQLGVTRVRVNRALQIARQNGVVRVAIQSRFAPCLELEEALKARFSLREASVAPGPGDPANVQAVIGAELGRYLSALLERPEIGLFAIAWGATLNHATRSIVPRPREDLEIVSVMGGLTRGSEVNSFEIATRLADLYAAPRTYLTAPLYASTQRSRDTILVQEVFQEVLAKIRRADALAMGVGDLTSASMLVRDGLPGDIRVDELAEAGAVGDMLGYFVDAGGALVDHPVNRRVIGISPLELRDMPNVILAAGGAHKTAVVAAALRSGVFDVVVTDEATATAVLRQEAEDG